MYINLYEKYFYLLFTYGCNYSFSDTFAASLEKEASFMQKRMLALEPRIEAISNDIKVI